MAEFESAGRFNDYRILLGQTEVAGIKIVYLAGLLKPDSDDGLHFLFLPNTGPLTE